MSGGAERLTKAETGVRHEPESWSPDGMTLSFNMVRGTNQGVWTMAMAGDRKPKEFVDAPNAIEKHSAFSPDGRWLAYMAGATAVDVYVQPFPATGAKYQISAAEGGRTPVWSRDGRQRNRLRSRPTRSRRRRLDANDVVAAGPPLSARLPPNG